MNRSIMWNKPWRLTEGFLIGAGMIVTGLLLQLAAGPIDWNVFSFPVNIIVLVAFLLIIAVGFLLRKKVYGMRFLASYKAAIPALAYALVMTVIMGLIRQVPESQHANGGSALSHMLSFWPFVLIYVWIAFILGVTILKRLTTFRIKDIPFMLNHAGLFVVMTTATLGNADMQRLKMTVGKDTPEWRAIDDYGKVHELPIAIQLENFRIDEYPPKLALMDNQTGNLVGGQQAETLLLDSTLREGQLGNWRIRLNKLLEYAIPVMKEDTTYYNAWRASGAVTAAHVDVEWLPVEKTKRTYLKKSGWLTCGSYRYPYQILKIDNQLSLAMLPREPQRYVSRVEILTKSGKDIKTDILVNKPFTVEGWKIYQLNYDTTMGRWSEISVLELVSDPWLPAVYAGIYMMLAGALCMFVMGRGAHPSASQREREGKR